MTPCVHCFDSISPLADDTDEFDLPVDRSTYKLDVVEGPTKRGGELREGGWLLRERHPGLFGVAPIVEADGEHLPRFGHRAAEIRLHERAGPSRHGLREVHKRVEIVIDPHQVGAEPPLRGLGYVGDFLAEDQSSPSVHIADPHR